MAIIGNTNHAVYLYPDTGTQLIDGTVNGYAALGNGAYYAVYGPGPYAFSIIVTGDVQSGGASSLDGGIVLGGPGIITNQGTIAGGAGIFINGYAYGGASYIKNSGLIEGGVGAAIYTYGEAGVSNTGRIIGAANGVYLAGGGVVTNTGTIEGGTGVGDATYYGAAFVINSSQIIGTSTDGVFANGTVVNDPGGTMTGAEVGVNLYGGGTLTNAAGLITGGTTGLAIYGYGNAANGTDSPAAVQNTGTIAGGAAGIGIDLSHTFATNIYNKSGGVITGGSYGIVEYNPTPFRFGDRVSDLTIGNAGTILVAGATTIQAATTTSYAPPGAQGAGISIDYGHIINTGTVSGATGVFTYGYATLYNSNRIAGTQNGVVLAAFGNATNKGLITGGTAGIDIGTLNQLSYILNQTGGEIIGGDYGVATYPVGSHYRYVSIGNAGYISGGVSSTGSLGLAGYHPNSGIVAGFARIINTGTVAGGYTGIVVDNYSYILNTNQIRGGITGINLDDHGTIINQGFIGAGGYAIRANYGSTITNTEGAIITGGTGITFSSFSETVVNAGTILATSGPAVAGFYGIQIFNRGLIAESSTAAAIYTQGEAGVYNYATITGAVTLGGGYAYNTGKITSAAPSQAALALTGPGYIINYKHGVITGAIGVQLASQTALYNYGAVAGGVTSSGTAIVYNYAGATITGQADGVYLASGTIADYGLIAGASHAVAFGTTGANHLILYPTATLAGGAYLGGGGIELLAAPSTGTFTTANYQDFTALNLDSHAHWTLTGPLTAGIDLTFGATAALAFTNPESFAATIENFTETDTIDLTGISLADITATQFAGGVLTLVETAGSLTFTFANPATFAAETFALFADGPGTGITLTPAPLVPANTPATPAWLPTTLLQSPTQSLTPITLHA